MFSLTITPHGPLIGTIAVPGDKSITHRSIILSALAEGESLIQDYCPGEDCLHTARCFRAMGTEVEETPTQLRLRGKGLWGLSEPDRILDCGNSGTGIRLMTGLLSGQDFFSVLTGDDSIRRRPMGRVVKPLREMGAMIAGRKGGELAPLAVTGRRLRGFTYQSPISSAQVKSSLLLAGLFAEGETTITEPRQSRDHTERLFRYLGVPLHGTPTAVTVTGRPSVGWSGFRLRVPGDLSSAAFFLVGATLVRGSDVTIEHVGMNPTRTGILEVLRQMGANIQVFNQQDEAGEPVADLRVRSASLKGVTVGADMIPQTIDEFPILCVAAALAEGETRISGAQELRVKESDRIASMATELRKVGVQVEELPDGMVITGLGGASAARPTPLNGAQCQSYGDHRVAMSMAIAGLLAKGGTVIDDTDCIETSFPGFSDKLLKLLTR